MEIRPNSKNTKNIQEELGNLALDEDFQWQFWHNLSLALGIPVEELKDRITAKEYKSWLRYYQVKGPFGERRLDFNFASLVKTIYEFITANAGRTDSPSVEDCLLQFKLPTTGFPEMGAAEAENIKRLLVKYEKYRK